MKLGILVEHLTEAMTIYGKDIQIYTSLSDKAKYQGNCNLPEKYIYLSHNRLQIATTVNFKESEPNG